MNKLDTKKDYHFEIIKECSKRDYLNNTKIKEQLYFDYKKIRYFVDNKNVVLDYSKKELEIAKLLQNTFGGEIFMLPRINIPKGIKTADYLWNNEYWDLKVLKEAVSQNRAIDNVIKNAKEQANNFILDITNTEIKRELILKQIDNLYLSQERKWINKIILIDQNKIIKIYSRKKAVPPPSGMGKAF